MAKTRILQLENEDVITYVKVLPFTGVRSMSSVYLSHRDHLITSAVILEIRPQCWLDISACRISDESRMSEAPF